MKPSKTVHSNRTIMFAELLKVMNQAEVGESYYDSMKNNIFNKATSVSVIQTSGHLRRLYDFDETLPRFKAFQHFWNKSDESVKSIIALLYAIGNDYLLSESIPVINNAKLGNRISIEKLEENIEMHHPNKYSNNTRRSTAQNIASSWKQAGFILGKIKNIRTQPDINYLVVAFAFLMAYLNGIRGDFILKSNWVKALSLEENAIRSLAIEANKRDLLQYHYAGNVTSITFTNLLKKLHIDGIEN
jgi:hypothetical protein